MAGSIPDKTISIVDTATDTLARTIPMSAGIRPMAFTTNPDGSTKTIIVQLSDFHGFATVDFVTGKETARVEHPDIPGEHPHRDGLQGAPAHGLAVSPDGTRLWSTSKVFGYAYVHSLPDLKEVGRVFVGQHPEWLTFTPDGKYVYVAAAGDNAVFVVDAVSDEGSGADSGGAGAEAQRHGDPAGRAVGDRGRTAQRARAVGGPFALRGSEAPDLHRA